MFPQIRLTEWCNIYPIGLIHTKRESESEKKSKELTKKIKE